MKIDSLIPMHNRLRNLDQVADMIELVAGGSFFSRTNLDYFAQSKGMKPSPLIKIAVFEDGKEYIHDGHHRLYAIFSGGRNYLHESEFVVERWKYQDYLEINLDQRWYTIFDPRIEVRIENIYNFKRVIEDLLAQKVPYRIVEQFIKESYKAKIYTEPRQITHIKAIMGLSYCNTGLQSNKKEIEDGKVS